MYDKGFNNPLVIWTAFGGKGNVEVKKGGPIEVWNANDLDNVRNNLTAEYIQMDNIDLSSYNWQPIGYAYNETGVFDATLSFQGIFDGNGFTISNINVNKDRNGVGLFGRLMEAQLRNIHLSNVAIIGGTPEGFHTGSLAGVNLRSEVINCSVVGGYLLGAVSVGGLVGVNAGVIEQCYTHLNIGYNENYQGSMAANQFGGLIGTNGMVNNPGKIYNCYSRSQVSSLPAVNALTAGFMGSDTIAGGEIINCYSTGQVLASRVQARRGFTSSVNPSSSLQSCYYDRDTSGCTDTGRGTPKTTAEMKEEATFIGWDFINTWAISLGINDGYPHLL